MSGSFFSCKVRAMALIRYSFKVCHSNSESRYFIFPFAFFDTFGCFETLTRRSPCTRCNEARHQHHPRVSAGSILKTCQWSCYDNEHIYTLSVLFFCFFNLMRHLGLVYWGWQTLTILSYLWTALKTTFYVHKLWVYRGSVSIHHNGCTDQAP